MREEFFNTFGYADDELSEDEMNEMLWEDEINFEKKMREEQDRKNRRSTALDKRKKPKKHLFW